MAPITRKKPSTRTSTPRDPVIIQGSGRQTNPQGMNPLVSGLGYITRRTDRPDMYSSDAAVMSHVNRNPLRVLEALRYQHPAMSQAIDNVLGFLCPPDGLRITGTQESTTGAGDDAAVDEATSTLDDLWDRLPQETGGLDGLLASMILSLSQTGMCCIEAVPGPTGTGIAGVFPVDSLTVFFKYAQDTTLIPFQRGSGVDKQLNTATFFFASLDGGVGNPYGFPRMAAALNPLLRSFQTDRDLHDALHVVGHPRIVYGIDYNGLWKTATEHYRYHEAEANAWVQNQITIQADTFKTIRSDDVMIGDKNGSFTVVDGGKFNGTPDVLKHFDRRMIQGLNTRPMLLGTSDATTETLATVLYAAEARSLERLRAVAVEVLLRIANLEFRLRGLPYEAEAEYDKIRVSEQLIDAQGEAAEMANDEVKVLAGAMTIEDFAQKHSGSGVVDAAYDGRSGEEVAKDYFTAKLAAIKGGGAAPATAAPDTQTESQRVREARKAAKAPKDAPPAPAPTDGGNQ